MSALCELSGARRELAAAKRGMLAFRCRALAYFALMRHARRNRASEQVMRYFAASIREVFRLRHLQREAIQKTRMHILQMEESAWKRVATVFEKRGMA